MLLNLNMDAFKKRPCGPVKSAKNPNAYTKEELVVLAVSQFKISKTRANEMTKAALCAALITGNITDNVPKTNRLTKTSSKNSSKIHEVPAIIEHDINTGFWVKDSPYYFRASKTVEDCERKYQTQHSEFEDISKCDSALVSNYFQHLKNDIAAKYIEGRSYYGNVLSKKSFEVVIPENNNPNIQSLELDSYTNKDFSLFSLICSQMAIGNSKNWTEILENLKDCPLASICDPCTNIGAKMAKSLIKIASLRIFADPEQSIMELPVNSIDAYNPEQKIGKFGMGFFSIFYWLIDHPKRFLVLQSYYKDNTTFEVTIKEVQGVLAFSLKTFPYSKITKTGLRIFLDANADPFTLLNVKNFNSQLDKLRFAKGADLHIDFDQQWWKFNSEPSGKDIYCKINQDYILIEDYATGISYETLFGSLFVPSISTKTLKMTSSVAFKNESRIIKVEKFTKLIFLVGGISVISIDGLFENPGFYILDLPADTRLPVSRDDIILTQNTMAALEESISILFEETVKNYNDVSSLQDLLQKYIDFTPNPENKKIVKSCMNVFYRKMKHRLSPVGYKYLYKFYPHFISSNTYDILEIERWFDENEKALTNIWYGTKVLYLQGIFETSNGGLTNYVFIDPIYKNRLGNNWISAVTSSYFYKKLYPINSSYGRQEYEKYEKISNASTIIKSGVVLEYFYSVLNKIESLDDRFNISSILIEKVTKNVLFLYMKLREEDFIKIITTFLEKLSSFIGNQTYGGVKYLLFSQDTQNLETSLDLPPDFDQTKVMNYNTQNIFYYINSLREGNMTDINFIDMYSIVLFHTDIYKKNLRYRKNALAFFKEVFEQSETFAEFSFCWLGAGLAFMKQESSKLPSVVIKQMANHYIDKVRSYKFNENTLVHLYKLFDKKDYAEALTFELLYKNRLEAIEWIKTSSNLNTIPDGDPLKTLEGSKFLLSELIRKLFKENPSSIDINFLKSIEGSSNENKLQIIEIAINEGTVKSFIEAVMTELVQNSIDAVREFKPKNKSILISIGKTEKHVVLKIQDFVGMSMDAFVYVGIPFLSTKTPSELVTGEMGSGFFNVYRESDRVVVQTSKDGVMKTSSDIAVRDENGRVVDIVKTVNIKEYVADKNGTTIEVDIPYSSDYEYASVVSKAIYSAHNVLGLANFSEIYFNGINVHVPRELICKLGYFELYITDKSFRHESYLLTKGVPFAPLSNYFQNALDVKFYEAFDNNFIVNITHGGYTPVQTRTRINMPAEQEADFRQIAIYAAFTYCLNNAALDMYNNFLDHIHSEADIFQLKFSQTTQPISKNSSNSYFLKYTSFFGQPTITGVINMCIENLGYEALKPEVRKVYIRSLYKSPCARINEYVYTLVDRWFSYKKIPIVKKAGPKAKVSVTENENVPDIPDAKITIVVKAWLKAFWEIAKDQKISGFGVCPSISAVVSYNDRDKAGYYNSKNNSIIINTYSWDHDAKMDLLNILEKKNIESVATELKNNRIWQNFFSYGFPSSTLVHELEHARRNSSHSSGGHDSFTGSLFQGEPSITRTFDQCANAIFQKILANNFYFEFFKDL